MEKRYNTGTVLVNDDSIVVSVNPFICHLTNKSDTDILLNPFNLLFSIEEEALLHQDGFEVPVFFEKNRIVINDEQFDLYMFWSEDVELKNHPIYNTITQETNDMINIIDSTTRVLFSSPSHKKQLGIAPSGFEKHSYLEFVHESDNQMIAHIINKVFENNEKHLVQFRVKNANGYSAVEASFNPIIGKNNSVSYIVIIMRDINIKEKDVKNIVEREQRFKSLFDQNPDFVFSLDLDFCFTDINDAMLDATGFTRDEITDRPFSTLITPEYFPRTVMSLIDVKKGVRKTYDSVMIKKHGNPIFVSLSLFPIFVHNQLVGIHGIAKDISKKKEYEKRIYQLAYTDTLTNLPNRGKFQNDLVNRVNAAKKDENKFSLLFFDVDNFKNVNDSLGHAAGDALLKGIAKRIKRALPENCHLYRMSGDEFTVQVENYEKRSDLIEIAKKVLNGFKHTFLIEGHEVLISSSIGIATYPEDTTKSNDLVRYADLAMYYSKQRGKNYYSFFNDTMVQDTSEQFHLNGNLRKAIENNEFQLFYQPIIDAKTGEMTSAEALIRWFSPDQGMISPGVFIPLAEVSGMIHSLGNWVIQESCRQLREWISKGYKVVPVSINVSGKQFDRQDVYRTILRKIRKYGLDPSLLTVEVTETVVIKRKKNVIAVLEKLKNLGCGLAIDDFGSGYSSLSYLKDFPVNRLKLDKSFIDTIAEDEKTEKMVQIIIDLGHVLDLEVIAEGVETKEEYEILKTIGTDGIQGYHFSKPLPVDEFEKAYLKR
ncbi:sensor domain-containing protein [Bacillus sp. Brlt_9]|uniref:sensor domain-containing protein n=1 Tax=Bacillus sp. Brlt_9 TaxID=3110916 RepID=UPI003F7CAA3F